MVRNKRTVLPTGHPRKYTSNGTTQASQVDRIAHNVALIAAGQRRAKALTGAQEPRLWRRACRSTETAAFQPTLYRPKLSMLAPSY
jgi:hypothetical protein